jgi:hypothetical protein
MLADKDSESGRDVSPGYTARWFAWPMYVEYSQSAATEYAENEL